MENKFDTCRQVEKNLLIGRDNLKNICEASDEVVYVINKQLQESEENYCGIVEGTAELIACVDMNGHFTFVNTLSQHVLGVEQSQCIGLLIFDFIHPDDKKRTMKWFSECIDNQIQQASIENRQVNQETGTVMDILWTSKFHYTADGSLKASNIIAHDITERKEEEGKIRNLLYEKDMLLKEVHHRIKNNMQIISNLLSMQPIGIGNHEAVSVFQDAIARIGSMGVLYDKLCRSERYEKVSLKEYLSQLTDQIVKIFPASQNIIIEKQIIDFSIETIIIFPIGLIINELFTNAIKYAFAGRNNGLIQISTTKENNHVTIIFEDDGVGMPELGCDEQEKGFGITLIDMLVNQINGSCKIESINGTKYIIEFEI